MSFCINHDFLGLMASFLTVGSLLPQVLRVYQTQRTRDLSLWRYTLVFLGTSLWGLYFWNVNWIAFLNETICVLLYGYILLYETYRKAERRKQFHSLNS